MQRYISCYVIPCVEVKGMSDNANRGHDEQDSAAAEPGDAEALTGVDSIEAYETEDGIVFYDAQNPLAWLKAPRTLTLEEQA